MGNFLNIYVGVHRQARGGEKLWAIFSKFTLVFTEKLGGGRKLWVMFCKFTLA